MAQRGRPRKNAGPAPQQPTPSQLAAVVTPPILNASPIPDHLAHLTPHRYTDAGIIEANSTGEQSRVQIGAGPVEKSIQQRRDALESSSNPWEAPDPRKKLAADYIPQGHRGRLLSPDRISQAGLRGWTVVRRPDGDPVKFGEMILGSMPEEHAKIRAKHFHDKGKASMQQVVNEFQQQQGQLLSAAGVSPRALSRDSSPDDVGLQTKQGENSAVERFSPTDEG